MMSITITVLFCLQSHHRVIETNNNSLGTWYYCSTIHDLNERHVKYVVCSSTLLYTPREKSVYSYDYYQIIGGNSSFHSLSYSLKRRRRVGLSFHLCMLLCWYGTAAGTLVLLLLVTAGMVLLVLYQYWWYQQ
jgi:hypothetical protein